MLAFRWSLVCRKVPTVPKPPGIRAKKLRVVALAPLTAGEIIRAKVLPEEKPYWQQRFSAWVRSIGARLIRYGI